MIWVMDREGVKGVTLYANSGTDTHHPPEGGTGGPTPWRRVLASLSPDFRILMGRVRGLGQFPC